MLCCVNPLTNCLSVFNHFVILALKGLIHQWCKMWLLHVTIEWESIKNFACGLEIPLSTTEQNLVHTWILVIMRLKIKTLWFLDGKITVLTIQICMISLTCRNQGVLSLSLIIITGNKWNVEDCDKPEINKLFWKSKVYGVTRANQRVISISPPPTQVNPDLQDTSPSHHLVWGYWQWLPRVMYQQFQILGLQGEQGVC